MTSQTVLITGATSGIGRYTALYLAERGYHVIGTGRREQALESLALEAGAWRLDTLPLDVTDAASIAAAKLAVDELTGGRGIDVLVNNAGFGLAGPTSEVSIDDLRRQYETNVFGLMAVTRAFLPAMRRRGAGRIVNVSSVGGRLTLPLFGVYNSTKYAIESLSDALRLELHPFGIKVVLIEPGVIATEFGDRSLQEIAPYQTADSPYAAVLARAEEVKAQSDRMAVGPHCVARAIHRAVRSRRPRARYIAPFRTRLMLMLHQLLPTSWSDAVYRRMVGLTPKMLSRGQSGKERQELPATS